MAQNADSVQAMARKLLSGLERCLGAVTSRPREFKPRPYLLPPLEAIHGHLLTGTLEALAKKSSAPDSPAALLLPALVDAVDACLLVLATLEEQYDLDGQPQQGFTPPEVVFWPYVALRGQARRLKALQELLESEVEVASGIAGKDTWDPANLLLSGSLATFWRRHFSGRAAVAGTELVAALSSWYDPLSEAESDELLVWLQCSVGGMVNINDVALVLDGFGVWRNVLFCTSWPELCPEALLPAILAGGGDRHTAMTAADLATEKRQKQRSAYLPDWSRERLRADRAALHALKSLGVQVAANVSRGGAPVASGAGAATGASAPQNNWGGLVVQFPSPNLASKLISGSSLLSRVCRELVGGAGLVARAAINVSTARCVAGVAASWFQIEEPRDRHITLSRIHRRKIFELRDDAEEMLHLQTQHQDLIRADFLETSTAEPPPPPPSAPPPPRNGGLGIRDGVHGTSDLANGGRSLRELLSTTRAAMEERQRWTMARVEAEIRRNAEGSADDPVEEQLAHLGRDADFVDHSEVLLSEINICSARQTGTFKEMAQMEQTLVALEATFAKFRRQLIRRDEELSKRISDCEEELASLSSSLVSQREAARAAYDSALDARLALAELMVPLPPPPPGPPGPLAPTDALEAQLKNEVEALKLRAEELEKRFKKARAAAKQKR